MLAGQLSAIFDESRFIGNRKFRNMLVISAAISVGVKLIAANYGGSNICSIGACIILMVAAIASSIYIIGILVSDDRKHSYFFIASFVKNIHSIIRSRHLGDDQLNLDIEYCAHRRKDIVVILAPSFALVY
jgi:hypothetical protein